jgi:hypothetical protein
METYHGDNVKKNMFGNITFDGMHGVFLVFNDWPYFSEVFRRARDKLKCILSEDAISV